MRAEETTMPVSLLTRAKYFLLFAVQLFLVRELVLTFSLEERSGVTQLLDYWIIAILLHFWLPRNLRPWLMLIATAVTIYHAIGLVSGLVFYSITGTFILVAQLKINRTIKTLFLLVGLLALILIRLQYFYMPRLYTAIPLVGMFFMFRFILFYYELKYETKASSWAMRLTYLYNPLNTAFPLFPVFDFKAWQRSYFETDEQTIYALAFRRIFFGISMLLLYRVSYSLNPNPANIQTAHELLMYLFLAYTSILRILGIYWFALGLLGLFGFHLPRVFEQVFFITGIGRIWRQINVYWKEFIQKLIYYPVYFKLRKKVKGAVIISGVITFTCTWFFHNWQFFWIKGQYPLRSTDFLYWLILGVMISLALNIQSKRINPIIVKEGLSNTVLQTIRASGVFILMCVMWSFWGSETIGEWTYLISRISNVSIDVLPIVAGFILLMTAAGIIYHFRLQLEKFLSGLNKLHHSLLAGLLLVPLLVIAQGKTKWSELAIVQTLIHQPYNQFDQENAEQGYYEQMGSSGSENPWQVQVNASGRNTWFSEAEIPVSDIRMRSLQPEFSVSHDGMIFSTNSFGMRSPEIKLEKDSGTIRIAILGASYEMGGGVSDEQVFARITEQKLNAFLKSNNSKYHIEILNFAVGAYHLPQYAWMCDNRIFQFQPDVVLSFAHSSEARRLNGTIARLIQNGVDLSAYDKLKNIRTISGASQAMSRTEIRNRLFPYNEEMLEWGYGYVAEVCLKNGARPVWVYLPSLGDEVQDSEVTYLSSIAVSSKFEPISLRHVYDNKDRSRLMLSPDDSHPNADGHQLIADELASRILSSGWFIDLVSNSNP